MTFPAIRTGTAAISVIGSGTMRRAAPRVRSFLLVSWRSFVISFRLAFVSRRDGGGFLSLRSDVASLISETFLLAVSPDNDKPAMIPENFV